MTPLSTTLVLVLLVVCVLLAAGCIASVGNGAGKSIKNVTEIIATTTHSETLTLPQCGSPKNSTPYVLINPMGYYVIGKNFRLNGTTNLETGKDIRISIYASVCDCAPLGQQDKNGENPLVFEQDTAVTSGLCGENKWLVSVNTSKLKADEYVVTASAVNQNVTGTSIFSIVETPLSTVYGNPQQQNSATTPANS